MRNEELLTAVLESGMGKRVKGSNLVYEPIERFNRDRDGAMLNRMAVTENWKLQGVVSSFNEMLALLVVNNSTGRREVWIRERHFLPNNKAKHVKALSTSAYNRGHPDSKVQNFEFNLHKCSLNIGPNLFQTGGTGVTRYITRAHSWNMHHALKLVKDIARRTAEGFYKDINSASWEWMLSRARTTCLDAKLTALTDVGESAIHTDAIDPKLQEYRERFERVELLMERTKDLDCKEAQTFWSAYHWMEGDLT